MGSWVVVTLMPALVTSLCVALWISVACRTWPEKPHSLGLGKPEQPCPEGSHLWRAGGGAAGGRQAPGVLWLEWQGWRAPGDEPLNRMVS